MSKYLKKFELTSQYEEYINSDMAILPNVSLIKDINGIHYNPIHDYSQDYLTFVAKEDGTFKFIGKSINYSVDNGETWTTLPSNTDTPTIQAGNKIMLKATLTPTSSGIGKFSSTGKFTAQGNVMSLLYGDDFIGQKGLTGKDYTFYNLFSSCIGLTNAKNICLPATILIPYCYCYMFYGCSALTTAPKLPAIILADNCYRSMFYGCTSLINAPELPATILAEYCYDEMFRGCTALTNVPELPATTLANNCYSYMFYNCTALTTVPSVLPATTLVDNCYESMFTGCTSLTNAPELPTTTLADYCYTNMFRGCTSLTDTPELPATTLTSNCYSYMFQGCTSLTNAPELPATTLTSRCYYGMFQGCTLLTNTPELLATTLTDNCYSYMFNGCYDLNYIKMLATDISATNCLNGWVTNVSDTGTFVKHPNMTSLPTGSSGIPEYWTVQDVA